MRARTVEIHMGMSQDVTRCILRRNLQGKCRKHFVRACAVEMQIDMPEEAFDAEMYRDAIDIYRENAGRAD